MTFLEICFICKKVIMVTSGICKFKYGKTYKNNCYSSGSNNWTTEQEAINYNGSGTHKTRKGGNAC